MMQPVWEGEVAAGRAPTLVVYNGLTARRRPKDIHTHEQNRDT
jgi:hypothetical protein